MVEATQFGHGVDQLASIYKEHIRIEDEEVFPAAGRALAENEKSAIALEMAMRRGVCE